MTISAIATRCICDFNEEAPGGRAQRARYAAAGG
jgi:hypothetical protein